MNQKIAKGIKAMARETGKDYKTLKKEYLTEKRSSPQPKLKESKRQARLRKKNEDYLRNINNADLAEDDPAYGN